MGTTYGNHLSMFLHFGGTLCWYVWYWWRNDYRSVDAYDGCTSSYLYGNIGDYGILHGASVRHIFRSVQLNPMGLRGCVLVHWIYWFFDRSRNHAEGETDFYRSSQL
jgi:hypothetical protein